MTPLDPVTQQGLIEGSAQRTAALATEAAEAQRQLVLLVREQLASMADIRAMGQELGALRAQVREFCEALPCVLEDLARLIEDVEAMARRAHDAAKEATDASTSIGDVRGKALEAEEYQRNAGTLAEQACEALRRVVVMLDAIEPWLATRLQGATSAAPEPPSQAPSQTAMQRLQARRKGP